MNKANFMVELTFSDNINQEQLDIIGKNVMQALISQVECSEQGLVGEEFDGYTAEIKVYTTSMIHNWNCTLNKMDDTL